MPLHPVSRSEIEDFLNPPILRMPFSARYQESLPSKNHAAFMAFIARGLR